jgi:hypothetical protein
MTVELPPLDDVWKAVSDHPNQDTEAESPAERIEHLIPKYGWPAVCDLLLEILASERSPADYQTVAEVLWGAALDGRAMPADRVIALLYYRFDPQGDQEDNLVWSITAKLRGIGYLSKYRPLDDPGVRAELASIKRGS